MTSNSTGTHNRVCTVAVLCDSSFFYCYILRQAATLREELEDSEREHRQARESHRRQVDKLNQELAKVCTILVLGR